MGYSFLIIVILIPSIAQALARRIGGNQNTLQKRGYHEKTHNNYCTAI